MYPKEPSQFRDFTYLNAMKYGLLNHLYTLYSLQFQSAFNSSLLQNLRQPVNSPTSNITTKEKQNK